MYAVLGASGHTGQVVAKSLLARGQKVRAIGRNPQHLQSLASHGAEVAAADGADSAALTKALQGAAAAYVMIPPNPSTDDYRGFQEKVSDAIAAALKNSGVKHVVVLSSIGADKAVGTGPVVGLHNLEQKINGVDGLNALHLRAGYFMENTLPQAAVVQHTGNVIGPLRPDLKLGMIATHDIGEAAAAALLHLDFQGKQTHELQGHRDLDYTEAAAVIGKAIGRSSLPYIHAPDDQILQALLQMGMSKDFAGLLLEMTGAMNSGHMKALQPRTTANTTPTSFEAFVNEQFVPAYQRQKAA
jgi:uncharacterized protein YbjT (DUF2867 family)